LNTGRYISWYKRNVQMQTVANEHKKRKYSYANNWWSKKVGRKVIRYTYITSVFISIFTVVWCPKNLYRSYWSPANLTVLSSALVKLRLMKYSLMIANNMKIFSFWVTTQDNFVGR
jgi:hypothetical protein